MTRVCVVGSVNADLTLTVDALPEPGATVMASSLVRGPGGKGANQAIAAARAGAEVQFVGAVGDDTGGAASLAHLRANGVGTEGVVRVPGSTGTAVVMVDTAAENAIVTAPGANAQLTVNSAVARRLVAESDLLMVQLETPVQTAVAAAQQARQSGATVFVNASPVPADPTPLGELAALTDVVVVNETEDSSWIWPVPHRVVTRGSRGASYFAGDQCYDIPTPAVKPVDTTGAGDVFAGVLAASWMTNPQSALRRACTAAALATLVPGAGDCAPRTEAIDAAMRAESGR